MTYLLHWQLMVKVGWNAPLLSDFGPQKCIKHSSCAPHLRSTGGRVGDSGLDQRRRYREGPRVVQFIFQVRMGKAHPGEELKCPASRGTERVSLAEPGPFPGTGAIGIGT